jgi:hypothetical protein
MPGRKKCDPSSNRFAICVAAGTECGLSTPDTCSGSTLVYCDDGYVTRSECPTLGFASCAPLTSGTTTIGAVCR